MSSIPVMPGIFRSVTMQSKRAVCKHLQGLGRAGAALHLVAGMAQHVGHRLAGPGVVVDHQHAAGRGRRSMGESQPSGSLLGRANRVWKGNGNVNTAPPWGPLAAATVPPWASAIRETMASPSPVPPCLVVKKGSKIRGRTSSGRPGPLSATYSSVPRGEAVELTVKRAALGHHVQGVEHEIQHGPADHFAIGPQRMLAAKP